MLYIESTGYVILFKDETLLLMSWLRPTTQKSFMLLV